MKHIVEQTLTLISIASIEFVLYLKSTTKITMKLRHAADITEKKWTVYTLRTKKKSSTPTMK